MEKFRIRWQKTCLSGTWRDISFVQLHQSWSLYPLLNPNVFVVFLKQLLQISLTLTIPSLKLKITCQHLCLKWGLKELLSGLYKNNVSQIFGFLSGACMGPITILNSQQTISLAFGDPPGDMFSQYCISAGSEVRRKNSLNLLFNISLNAQPK